MKRAPKKAKAETTVTHSEIIKQCTIYAQATAAFKGGFYTDPTGNFDHAGGGNLGGRYLDAAKRALKKLAALSRERRPMTAAELFAEAKVAKLIMRSGDRPASHEADFVQRFAKDVARYLKQALECER